MDARRLAEMEEQWDTVPAAQHVAESKLRAALTQVQFERNRLENDLAAARAEVAQLRLHLARIADGHTKDAARYANAALKGE